MNNRRDAGDERHDFVFRVGIGGFFDNLSSVVDMLSELATQSEAQRNDNIHVEGSDNNMRGMYSFTVSRGIRSIPRSGSIPPTRRSRAAQRVVAETHIPPAEREPLVDVFHEAQEVVIVAELPGVSMADIRINLQDDILLLETTGNRHYTTEILLPDMVDTTTLQQTYRNGILEVRLKKVSQAV